MGKSIPECAFYGADSLTGITIPEGVTQINAQAFQNCSALEELTLPAGLVQVDSGATVGCTSLSTVYYGGTPAQWSGVRIDEAGNDPLDHAEVVFGAYELTFSAGEGSGAMESVTVPAGTAWLLPGCGFTPPADKRFDAWRIGASRYQEGDAVVFTGDTAITALWGEGHRFSETWSGDDTRHWHECLYEGCDVISGNAEHSWDAGTVTKEAAVDTAGEMEYVCTVCGRTKTETFRLADLPYPFVMQSVTVLEDSGTVRVAVRSYRAAGGTLLAAAYAFDGRLLSLGVENVAGSGDVAVALDLAGAKKLAVFIVDSLSNPCPVCEKLETRL